MKLVHSLLCLMLVSPLAACLFINQEQPRDESKQAEPMPPVESVEEDVAPAPSTSISGVVVNRFGQPLKAKVGLVTQGGGSRSMSTPESGYFRFDNLKQAAYLLNVSTDSGLFATFPEVAPSSEPRNYELRHRGGVASISMTGRDAVRIAVMSGNLRIHDFTLREGKVARLLVPAGRIAVVLYQGDLREQQILEFKPGGEGSAIFDIPNTQ